MMYKNHTVFVATKLLLIGILSNDNNDTAMGSIDVFFFFLRNRKFLEIIIIFPNNIITLSIKTNFPLFQLITQKPLSSWQIGTYQHWHWMEAAEALAKHSSKLRQVPPLGTWAAQNLCAALPDHFLLGCSKVEIPFKLLVLMRQETCN